jgi:hypothetical protein
MIDMFKEKWCWNLLIYKNRIQWTKQALLYYDEFLYKEDEWLYELNNFSQYFLSLFNDSTIRKCFDKHNLKVKMENLMENLKWEYLFDFTEEIVRLLPNWSYGYLFRAIAIGKLDYVHYMDSDSCYCNEYLKNQERVWAQLKDIKKSIEIDPDFADVFYYSIVLKIRFGDSEYDTPQKLDIKLR